MSPKVRRGETGSEVQRLKDDLDAEPAEVSNLLKFSLTKPDFEQSHPVGKLGALGAHSREKLEVGPGEQISQNGAVVKRSGGFAQLWNKHTNDTEAISSLNTTCFKSSFKKKTLTRLGVLQSGVPGCPNVITLRVEAIGLKESRRWTGMDAYGEAG